MTNEQFSERIKKSLNSMFTSDKKIWSRIQVGISNQEGKKVKIFPTRLRMLAVASVAVILIGGIGLLSMRLGGFSGKPIDNIPAGVKDSSSDIYDVTSYSGMDESELTDESEDDTPMPGQTSTALNNAGSAAASSKLKIQSVPQKTNLNSKPNQNTQQSGVLTAGELNDNRDWKQWRGILTRADWIQYQQKWGITPFNRIEVRVTDGNMPVNNVKVKLENNQGEVIWQGKTDNKGKAYLFYSIFAKKADYPHRVTAQIGEKQASQVLNSNYIDEPVDLVLPGVKSPNPALDLMLVLDTTGSMSDELSYLQRELKNVISTVKHDNDNIKVRLSVNFYRDVGDEYVVRSFPFSENIDNSIHHLMAQSAKGGGDRPEAVEQALENAINQHEWAADSTKLLLLVLDAPPHYTPAITAKMHSLIADAAGKGIRIIPVGCSGIDKETEFLLRSISVTTGGSYVFLTDDSGVGNKHLEPTADSVQVEKLNALLIRVINEYLK